MTDLRKAAQMALDWRDKNGELLFALGGWDFIFEINNWSQSLRGALAQPEPEPFGIWHRGDTDEESYFFLYKDSGDISCEDCVLLYTALPQREWVGLTEEEVEKIANSASSKLSAIYIVEAELKGKNYDKS